MQRSSQPTESRTPGTVPGFWPGAPDLAVEVISPRDTYSDVAEKALDWLYAGTRMVLVVDPRCHTVTVYRSSSNIVVLSEDDAIDGADVVGQSHLDKYKIISSKMWSFFSEGVTSWTIHP